MFAGVGAKCNKKGLRRYSSFNDDQGLQSSTLAPVALLVDKEASRGRVVAQSYHKVITFLIRSYAISHGNSICQLLDKEDMLSRGLRRSTKTKYILLNCPTQRRNLEIPHLIPSISVASRLA